MKRMGMRLAVALFTGLLLCLMLSVHVLAEDTVETVPPSFSEMGDTLPDEFLDSLPDGLFSENMDEVIGAAEEMTGFSYLVQVVLDAVGLRLDDILPLLLTLIALILIAAVLRTVRESLRGRGGELFGFCLRLLMFAAIVSQAVGMVETVQAYFASLRTLTLGMMPVMGGLYALGGNVGQAAVSEEILIVFLGICQYVGTTVTPPFCGACMSFALLDAFDGRVKLAPLSALIKKWFAWLLGFIMFLLGVALSTQSALASRTDSLGMKGVKYAVGNMVPVVGGAVSGTLGTVAETVSALRGITGVSGVILLVILLIPTLVQLLLYRWCFSLASTAAGMLGCDGEARLMGEIGSLYGYLIAAVSVCAVVFVLALGLFIHGTVALGG